MNQIAEQLRRVERQYQDRRTFTGEIRIADMAHDAAMEIEHLDSELTALKSDIEAGRLVRLPAAIGQLVFVPVEDGGMYAPYVNGIAFLRPDAHDAVMEAVTTVGIDRERLTFMIARENKGTHWFETEEAARAALGKEVPQ